jgi:choline dehydrogenase-like flavoprotein
MKRTPVDNTAHACGTLMVGNDPMRSVVDRNGMVQGFANLYVADGSVMSRSGRVNPALTIYAWGLRLATYLQSRLAH